MMRAAIVGLLLAVAASASGAIACNQILAHESPVLVESTVDASSDAPVLCDGGVCGQDACDGPCTVDCGDAVITDPDDNCGWCGHSCLGGKCKEGRCLPVVLGSDEQYPRDVLVDLAPDGYVYWSSIGDRPHILRRLKAPSSASVDVVYDGSRGFPADVFLDETALYWRISPDVQHMTVYWANKDGSSPRAMPLDDGFAIMAKDSAALYWITTSPRPALRRWPLRADVSQITTAWLTGPGDGSRNFRQAVAEPGPGGRIFWQEGDGIHRTDKDGSKQAPLFVRDPPGVGFALALSEKDIYFTTQLEDAILRIDKDGQCPGRPRCPEIIADSRSVSQARQVVVDGDKLYWGNYGDGRIVRANLDGSEAATLFTAPLPIMGLAVDDRAIYFTAGSLADKGTAWKLAK